MATTEAIALKLVPKLHRAFFNREGLVKSRYKVAYGGRGSGKSWTFARMLIALAYSRKCRILCTREVQKSIKDSVHRLLSDQIELLGLSSQFDVLRDEIRSKTTGSQFLFAGLRDTTVDSLKSYEGIDYCWVEEAQTVSERSWEILIPTIRKPGSEIWVSFNPNEETDPTFLRFVKSPPPDCIEVKVNWHDNPSIPSELVKEKDYLYSVDPEAAAHVWGGECRKMSDAQVLRGRWKVESFEPKEWWNGPYYGADWGFANDPTVLIRCWVDGRTLYVEYEAYEIGVEVDHTPALFDTVPGARKHLIRADCARPETISYMVRQGFNAMGVEKWSGSIEDGVEFLRSFEVIVIHPRCEHTAQEARLYSYKVDRLTGDILPQLVDKHNNCIDSIRYALTPMIRGYSERSSVKQETAVYYNSYGSNGWMAR